MKIPKLAKNIYLVPPSSNFSLVRLQITLDKFPLKKNKAFMQALFANHNSLYGKTFLEKLDGSKFQLARTADPDMTVEMFTKYATKKTYFNLQIGSPRQEQIIFGARQNHPTISGAQSYASFECIYHPINYETVNKLFETIYGFSIDDIVKQKH